MLPKVGCGDTDNDILRWLMRTPTLLQKQFIKNQPATNLNSHYKY